MTLATHIFEKTYEAVMEEPQKDSSRAVGEPLEGWHGVVDVHSYKQLHLTSELVIRDAV